MTGDAERDGQDGATLLELLVALALLALLSVYAVTAIRYLQNFDRVQARIEERAAVEAVRTHLRRSIEAMRVAFLIRDGATPKLAFAGRRRTLTFVTDADSRLEFGGLYLVRFGLDGEASDMSALVTERRAFRPRMDAVGGGRKLVVLDRVTGLAFSYFGSPQEGVKPDWYEDWPEAGVLPQAVRVEMSFPPGDARLFPPLYIPIMVAR